jgi:hypothetical protein
MTGHIRRRQQRVAHLAERRTPPPGGIEAFDLWGAGPVGAFARKIAKLNTKSPSTGRGG